MVWQKCSFIGRVGCRQHSSDITAELDVYPNSSSHTRRYTPLQKIRYGGGCYVK